MICIQEAWGWGAGFFWPLVKLAQCAESLPGCLWRLSYPIYAVGALGVLLPIPPRWEPKPHIARRVAVASGHVLSENLFAVGDVGDSQDCCHAVLDSGLLLLVNERPSASGFARYHSKRGDDSFANKGYLWAFLQERKLLVVNTHLQASGGEQVKLEQLRQLRVFLDGFSAANDGLTIMAAGDWNLNLDRIGVVEEILGLQRLSSECGATKCLDHVLCNVALESDTTTEDIAAHGNLSDHPLVQVRCNEVVKLE